MSDRKTKDKWGATRGKLALVAVLSVVLVMVVVGQLPGSSPAAGSTASPTAAENGKQTRAKKNSRPRVTQKKPSAPSEPSKPWPQLTMQEVLQHDPFVVPAWAVPEKKKATTPDGASQTDGQLKQLQQQGASVVIISNQDKVATIGNQQIRIGDSIQGHLVIDITPQGVVLADPESR